MIRKNKKRIDPRYFLNETTYRDLDEEEGYQPDVSRAGPELDVQDVLQKVAALFKAVDPVLDDLEREGPEKIVADAQMWTERDPKKGLRMLWNNKVGHLYAPMRAMVPIYDEIKKGWVSTNGPIDILAHHAGNLAEIFLNIPDDQQRIQFLQNPEAFQEFITNAMKWGKGLIR